ncbi:MAG: hypothetical protein R3D51_19430 [Hyphomicrobiaceae bacterium]
MIIKREHNGNFTIVPNAIFVDKRLSIEAKGVLGYLLSRPPNWEVRHGQLQAELGIGRRWLERILNEIIAAGYMERDEEQGRDECNRFKSYDYVVRDVPLCAAGGVPVVHTAHRRKPLRDTSTGSNKTESNKTYRNKIEDSPPPTPPATSEGEGNDLRRSKEAKRRLADEYDAAQERWEVVGPKDGQHVAAPHGNCKATAAEIGLTRKQIHEARIIRDAEAGQPDGRVESPASEPKFDEVWSACRGDPGKPGPALAEWRKLRPSDRRKVGELLGPHGLDIDGMWLCKWLQARRWEAPRLTRRGDVIAASDRLINEIGSTDAPLIVIEPHSPAWHAERNRMIAAGKSVDFMDAHGARGGVLTVRRIDGGADGCADTAHSLLAPQDVRDG